jgi:cell division initiation protein
MEISGKVLREVEFRDRLRGYDTDEVDEFLEKVAVAVDDMHAELARLAARGPQPASHRDDTSSSEEESIRKMLVLAQRTADLAVSEARDEADRLLAEARSQSEAMLLQAQEAVRRMREDAEREVSERIGRLEGEHERLEGGIRSLASLLESEKARLTEGLAAALRFVDETLSIPGELAEAAEAARASERREPTPRRTPQPPEPPERPAGPQPTAGRGGDTTVMPTVRELPDVEAEITADAATAAAREEPEVERGRFSAAELSSLAPAIEADEELWARWAAGGGLPPTIDARTQPVTRVPSAPRLDRRPATGRGGSGHPSDGPSSAPSA